MTHKSTNVRILKWAAHTVATLSPGFAAWGFERLFLTPPRHKTPPRETRWLAGATRSTLRFDARRQLPIFSWGEGPTVLLVHGWSGRGSQLGAFVEPLVREGYRVVAFDGPSHGQADGRLSGIPEFATAIGLIAAQYGPLQAVVAHSMGAAATTVALSRGLEAQHVVFVAPPVNPEQWLPQIAGQLGLGDEVARRTRDRIERRFAFRFEEVHVEALAPQMEVPLLLVHDRKDADVPYEESARMAQAWPGATLLTTSGLGHRRILRDPAVIDAAVAFLGPPAALASLPSPNPRRTNQEQEKPMANTTNLYDHLLGHIGMRWDDLDVQISDEEIWADLSHGRDDAERLGPDDRAGNKGGDPDRWLDGAA